MKDENKIKIDFWRLPVVHKYPHLLGKDPKIFSEETELEILEKIQNEEELNESEKNFLFFLDDLDYIGKSIGKELSELETELLDTATNMIEGFDEERGDLEKEESLYGKVFVFAGGDDKELILVSPSDGEKDFLPDRVFSKEDLYGRYIYLHDFFNKRKGAEKVFKLYAKKNNTDYEVFPFTDEIVLLYKYEDMYLACEIVEDSETDLKYSRYVFIPDYIVKKRYYCCGEIIPDKTSREIYLEIVRNINNKIIERNSRDYPDSYKK